MEGNTLELKSVWGNWWATKRKWLYPAWLCYETTVRFYDYAYATYPYFINQQDNIGAVAAQVLAIVASVGTFAICFAFLTIPGCIALFKFFKSEKTYYTSIESQIKKYF